MCQKEKTAMAQLPGRDISFLFILLPVAIWLTSSFLSAAAWAPASWRPHLSRAASGASDASHVLEPRPRPPCSIASCPASREPASGACSTRSSARVQLGMCTDEHGIVYGLAHVCAGATWLCRTRDKFQKSSLAKTHTLPFPIPSPLHTAP